MENSHIPEVFMNSYSSISGIITQIQPGAEQINDSASYGCTLFFTIRSRQQEEVIFTVTGDTYVVDNFPFNPGDSITIFYDTSAPVPLVYPPRYRAIVAALGNYYQYYLGEFHNNLVSKDGTLQLSDSVPLPMLLPNGQPYSGALTGKPVLVEYTSSTKSIPAQVVPNRLFVFCYT